MSRGDYLPMSARWRGHRRSTAEDYTDAWGGHRVGQRVVVECLRIESRAMDHTRMKVLRVQCDCGREDVVRVTGLSCVRSRCHGCGIAEQIASQREASQPSGRDWLYDLLREVGDACPEVWRGDSEASVEACAELADTLGPQGQTLEAVGSLLGVSREAIRQCEANALRKLRLAGGPVLRELWEHVRDRDDRTLWDRAEEQADPFG